MEHVLDVNAGMRAAIDGFDWRETPLGPRDGWSPALRTLLSMVLDTPFPMLIMWGPDLIQVYNEGYVPIFGDKHPQSLGQPAAECWADIWGDVGPLLRGVYERGEAVFFENLPLMMQRRGGYEQAYFTFSYSPIREDERVAGVICVVNETTAHVLRERESVERAEALAALDRAKTEFFNNVSHEFRTPLTLMLGPLEELVRTLPEYEQRQTADLARRNALRLQKLVNTLLDFAAAQSGIAKALRARLDVDSLTADLASEFRSAFERAGLYLDVKSGAGRTVSLDRVIYEKIVLNLLSNALKFTFNGGVTVSTAVDDSNFVLRVADTGIGIAAEDLPKVFERFTRVHGARSRTHEGTGIGLALVKELVELHGGTIDVSSEPEHGSAFTVRFPVAAPYEIVDPAADTSSLRRQFREEADAFTRAAALEPAAVPAGSNGKCVLIADDNADLRAYLARLLGSRYQVRVAANGVELLNLAQSTSPDLIVADVMMPQMNGFEALQRLRAQAKTAQTPVILLSARAGEEAAAEGFARGADDYIVKPFVAADLLARVDALLRRTRGHRAHGTGDGLYQELASAIADRFISAVSTQAVFAAVTQTLTPAFADWSVVQVPRADGVLENVSLLHGEPAKTELGKVLATEYPSRLDDGSAGAAVFATAQPLFMPVVSPQAVRESARDARHAAILSALDLRSAIVVPVLSGSAPVATIGVIRAEGSPAFTESDLEFLQSIAARTALAYENARVQERERTIATTLQRALLPSALPAVPGLRFSASYSPAAQESLVGGDWYDAFAISRQRIVVSIGDVVGHGFDAATVMATLRQSVRSLALEDRDPGEILGYLNRLLFAEKSGRLATAYIAIVDPQTLETRVASAGHPSAIRIDGDGQPSTLAAGGVLLGADENAEYASEEYGLQPGDMVALYTDGYIEEHRDLSGGEREFVSAVAAARRAADPATAVHLEIFGSSPPRDDTALLTFTAEPTLPYLDVRIAALPALASRARVAVRRFLAATALSPDRQFDVLLAVGEAIINAIEHAYDGEESGVIRIAGNREGDTVVIDVEDEGVGWDSFGADVVQRGYGLPLMHALSDAVEIDRNASGTRVRLRARTAVAV